MSLPDGESVFCKKEDCGVYKLPAPFCDDCATDRLTEARFTSKQIERILRALEMK